MSDLQKGAKAQLFAENQYLENVQDVTVMKDGQVVELFALEKFVGVQDGPGKVDITLVSIIPSGGSEFPFEAYRFGRQLLLMQVGMGPNAYAAKGRVKTVERKASTEGTVETVTWVGPDAQDQ